MTSHRSRQEHTRSGGLTTTLCRMLPLACALAAPLAAQSAPRRLPHSAAGYSLGMRASAIAGWGSFVCSPAEGGTTCQVSTAGAARTILVAKSDVVAGIVQMASESKRAGATAENLWAEAVRARYVPQYGEPDSVRLLPPQPGATPRLWAWWSALADSVVLTVLIDAPPPLTFGTVVESWACPGNRTPELCPRAAASPATAAAVAQADPAAGSALRSCVLVMKGAGSRFDDTRIDSFWRQINVAIADGLVQRLPAAGFAAESELVPRDGAMATLLTGALGRTRCDRVLEIQHRIGVDSVGSFFAFEVRAYRMIPGANDVFTVGPDLFKRAYRFARTEEEMGRFDMGVFAGRVMTDLTAERALSRD